MLLRETSAPATASVAPASATAGASVMQHFLRLHARSAQAGRPRDPHGLAARRCLLGPELDQVEVCADLDFALFQLLCRDCRHWTVWLRVDHLHPLLRTPALRCPSMRPRDPRCPLLRTAHSNPQIENPTPALATLSWPSTCSRTSPPTHRAADDGAVPLSSLLLLRTSFYLLCLLSHQRHDRTASCPEQTRGSEFHASMH